MSGELKKKTIQSFKWSFIERVFSFLFTFIIGVLVARVLQPADFGVMGLLVVFTSLSQILVDGGFSLSLIQKKDVSNLDYSTVFYLNLGIASLLYLILFALSWWIAEFYHLPILTVLVKIVGLNIIINSLGLVQTAKLTKELNIQLQLRISFLSLISSGAVALFMVYSGYGLWTLVFQTLSKNIVQTTLLWYYSKWRPNLIFDWSRIKSMYHFSKNILALGVLGVIYDNIFLMSIGKLYSSREVGLYSKSNQMQQMPLSIYTSSLTKILLPIFSEANFSDEKLRSSYAQFIGVSAMLIFPLMAGISVLSEPLVVALFTDKWIAMASYLKVMACYGALYPLIAINLNLLLVKNRSDLYIKLDIFKFILAFVMIFFIHKSVYHLIIGFGLLYCLGFFIHAIITKRIINYSVFHQLRDVSKPFIFSALMFVVVNFTISFLPTYSKQLLVGIPVGILTYGALNLLLNYQAIKDLISLLRMGYKK